MDMQVLPGPVFSVDGVYGHLFICQQRHQMFSRGAASGEDGGGFSAEMGNSARHVDAAAARLKHRRATAQLTFRVDLRRHGRGVEGRGECQRINRSHHDLLLSWVLLSLAPFGRKAT